MNNQKNNPETQTQQSIGHSTTPDSASLQRVIATLEVLGQHPTPPQAARLDAAMAQVWHSRTAAAMHAHPDRRHSSRWQFIWRGGWRQRVVALAATIALMLGGAGGYLYLNTPATVSAQTVLSRAAAAMRLAPNQAIHAAYSVRVTTLPAGDLPPSSPKSAAVTAADLSSMAPMYADVWVQADSHGDSVMSAQTLWDHSPGTTTTADASAMGIAMGQAPASGAKGLARSKEAGHDRGPILLDRYIQIGSRVYGYESGNNAIVIPGTHDEHPGWMIPNDGLNAAGITQELSTLAQHSPQQVSLLPQQTLDGSTVDVIAVNGWTDAPAMRTVFYFDARSFVLRGFDTSSISASYPTPSWQVRLSSFAPIAATDVPAGTFILNAPPNAPIQSAHLEIAAFTTVFASLCHSTLTTAQLEHLLSAKSQTLLSACQASSPTVTRDALVAALIAPHRVDLDTALAAGQITQAQENAAIAAQQTWMNAFVTTAGGTEPPQ